LNSDTRLLNSEERQIKILQFVRDHPGWLIERVCKALTEDTKYMSRKTFFKELDVLITRREIIVKNKNKRDKLLFVNESNLVITVTKELEQFEKDFLKLAKTISGTLEKTIFKMSFDESTINNLTNAESKFADYYQASYQLLLNILFRIVDSYIFRFLIKWSSSNLKEEDKVQLFAIIFSKISKILIKIPKFFKHTTLKDGSPDLRGPINKRLEGAKPLITLQKLFYEYNIEDEVDKDIVKSLGIDSDPKVHLLKIFSENKVKDQVNRVIDDIWNIDKEICEFVYQEPLIYNFDFDYKKDGWKQLVKKYEPYFEQNENL
jgi:hypothetical protein